VNVADEVHSPLFSARMTMVACGASPVTAIEIGSSMSTSSRGISKAGAGAARGAVGPAAAAIAASAAMRAVNRMC